MRWRYRTNIAAAHCGRIPLKKGYFEICRKEGEVFANLRSRVILG